MPAAIAIPLITGAIGAGTAIAGAKIQSGAAKNAAKLQSASADKALAVNQGVYRDQQALMNPYVQGGQDAYARLFSQQFGTPYQPQQAPQAPTGPQARPLGGGPMGPVAGARPTPFQQAMDGQPAGGMVTIQAPTGETRQVPREQAQMFVSRGGKVVG